MVEVEGMNTYVDFDVIKIIDEGSSYPTLLGIGWANDNLAMIKFKKRVMTFENRDIRFIAPLDPSKGRRYVEPVKEEVVGGWDHAYNILEDYVYPTTDGELRWRSLRSASSYFDDALENWQNQLHEVSIQKCGRVLE